MISALTPVPYRALHSYATGCAGGLCTRVPHVSRATPSAGTPTRLTNARLRRCPINQPTSSSWHVALTKLDFTFTEPAYARVCDVSSFHKHPNAISLFPAIRNVFGQCDRVEYYHYLMNANA